MWNRPLACPAAFSSLRSRLGVGLLLAWSLAHGAASAPGSIVVITSSQAQAYGAVLDGFRSGLGESASAVTLVDLATGGEALLTTALAHPSARLVVTVGAQATTAVTSVARLDPIPEFGDDPTDLVVPVDVLDADGNPFVTARITMHVAKKR